MDDSNKYILMCEKATEIQELRQKHPIGISTTSKEGKEVIQITREIRNHYRFGKEGDFIFEKGCKMGKYEGPEHLFVIDGNKSCTYYADTGIWLPRQDQLQDMLVYDELPLDSFIVSFWRWYEKLGGKELLFKSMEQFLLAYVMNKKYGKVWKGDKWSKIGD